MGIVITIRDRTHDGSDHSPNDFLDAAEAAVQRVKQSLPIDDGVYLLSIGLEKGHTGYVSTVEEPRTAQFDAVQSNENDAVLEQRRIDAAEADSLAAAAEAAKAAEKEAAKEARKVEAAAQAEHEAAVAADA